MNGFALETLGKKQFATCRPARRLLPVVNT